MRQRMDIETTVKEEFEDIGDLMEAKTFLTDDLKKRYNAEVSFTLYQEIYNTFPSFRNSVTNGTYFNDMKQKYLAVYNKVIEVLEDGKD